MINIQLVDSITGKIYHTFDPFGDLNPEASQDEIFLGVCDPVLAHGTFQSATRTTAGTTTVVTPLDNGSLIVNDLVISGERQASSDVTVQFTDGTNTAVLFLASQVDAPPNIAHSFKGRVQGWQDARLDMITSGAGDATVLICYTKVPNGLPYAEWNALR